MSNGLRYKNLAVAKRQLASSSGKKPRAKPREFEHVEQVVFIRRIRTLALNDPRYCLAVWATYATPNGGERNVLVAKRLKSEGVQSGISDLFTAYPSSGYNGLYIEMKAIGGGQGATAAQNEWIDLARYLGYRAEVCNGSEEAFALWKSYVSNTFTGNSTP